MIYYRVNAEYTPSFNIPYHNPIYVSSDRYITKEEAEKRLRFQYDVVPHHKFKVISIVRVFEIPSNAVHYTLRRQMHHD